jgi:hypothetical protein
VPILRIIGTPPAAEDVAVIDPRHARQCFGPQLSLRLLERHKQHGYLLDLSHLATRLPKPSGLALAGWGSEDE